jgi:uncharacterized protein
MVTRRQIRAYAEEIARQFRPRRIILFGSYAYGKPTRDSDVDLLVVTPHKALGANKATERHGSRCSNAHLESPLTSVRV